MANIRHVAAGGSRWNADLCFWKCQVGKTVGKTLLNGFGRGFRVVFSGLAVLRVVLECSQSGPEMVFRWNIVEHCSGLMFKGLGMWCRGGPRAFLSGLLIPLAISMI